MRTIGGQGEGGSIFTVFLWTSFVDDPKAKFYYEKSHQKSVELQTSRRRTNVTGNNDRRGNSCFYCRSCD